MYYHNTQFYTFSLSPFLGRGLNQWCFLGRGRGEASLLPPSRNPINGHMHQMFVSCCVVIGQWPHSKHVPLHIHLARSIYVIRYSLHLFIYSWCIPNRAVPSPPPSPNLCISLPQMKICCVHITIMMEHWHSSFTSHWPLAITSAGCDEYSNPVVTCTVCMHTIGQGRHKMYDRKC